MPGRPLAPTGARVRPPGAKGMSLSPWREGQTAPARGRHLRAAAAAGPRYPPCVQTEPLRAHDELLALVRRRAEHEGLNVSPYPGVWFWRRDRPGPKARGHSTTLSIAATVQGSKVAHIGGRALTYDARHYFVLTGETEFASAVTRASPEEPYLSVGVNVPPELVARTLLALASAGGEAAGEPEPAFVTPLDAPMLDALCRLVRALDDPAERAVLAPLAIEEIVFRLLRSDSAALLRQAVGRGDDARIQEAMAFIRANATARLSVEDLARRMAMSPSHFAHRFRAVARVSPMRYVKHVRLHEARALLLRGARAGEVADRVGYASASHFTRDFKSCFGVPPAEYVRRLREGPQQDPAREAQPSA